MTRAVTADQLSADGAHVRLRMEARGEGAGGAGEVEGHRGQHPASLSWREMPRRQVREPAVPQVGDDLFDDCVMAVTLELVATFRPLLRR